MSTWMVVEDEPDIHDVLLAMFEIWGIDGVAFTGGTEAIAWIEEVDLGRTVGELPELALLDIRLPDASGPEVAERMRRSPRLQGTAIVMVTAYRLNPTVEAQIMEKSQADYLMYKPLPAMADLRRKLDEIVVTRRARLIDATPNPVAPETSAPKLSQSP